MTDRTLRILLIDDDEASFAHKRALLAQPGMPSYQLDWRRDYRSGLDCVLRGEHDAYLISYRLGAESGLQLLKDAMARGCRAPLILLTGEDDRTLDLQAMQAGAADYLIKPRIDAASLERSIRYSLERKRREQVETSLHDSEALYHSLVDSLPVCVLRKDLAGRFIFANRAYCEFTGRSADGVLGKTDYDFSPPEVAAKFQRDDHRVVATGLPVREIEINRTGGHASWVEVIKTPVYDARRTIVGTQAIFWDVSERQRAVEALKIAKDSAEAADRAKSEFLANMSHEIRTPMNGVIGMTELALRTTLTAQQREYILSVKRSADGLLRLLNDILDFSKIEAGRLELEAVDFDLRRAVGDTINALAVQANQKPIGLSLRVAPDVPAVVIGDPGRLQQILVNLVGNAIKFTRQGEVEVSVRRGTRQDDKKVELLFDVRDTGIGIPTDKQQLIFGAFSQADASTTRRFGGTGLGLAISSKLLGLMDGQLWLESELGKGSVFHFAIHLPVGERPLPSTATDAEALRDAPVLIIDDNRTNSYILESMVASWGMRPRAADGGSQGLEELRRAAAAGDPFRFVVLDALMPDMNGFEVAEQIQNDPALRASKVIMVSSSNDPQDAQRGRALGVRSYLSQPVKHSNLLEALLHSPANEPCELAAKPDVAGPASLAPFRILLAEDGITNQRVAVELLSLQGYAVVLAKNGREAVEAFAQNAFDVVLMDLQMPEMDGFEATAAIRQYEQQNGGHASIIALTAHAMKGDRERCLAAGMDDYVAKPIDWDQLFKLLRRIADDASRKNAPATQVDLPERSTARVVDEHADADESPGASWSHSPGAGDRETLDFEAAARRVPGGAAFLRQILSSLICECQNLPQEIREAFGKQDAKQVERAAHTLKSSARLFAAERLAEAATRVEDLARERNLAAAGRAIDALEVEARRLCAAIHIVAGKSP